MLMLVDLDLSTAQRSAGQVSVFPALARNPSRVSGKKDELSSQEKEPGFPCLFPFWPKT